MPSVIKLFERHNNNPVFVETGTLQGEGVKSALFAGFTEIHSIELAEKHYLYSKDLLKYQNNIHLYHGDSQSVLQGILDGIESTITFWLDAHYSGGDTAFKDVLYPLMKELEIIGKHKIKNHTIIIDDLRLLRPEFPSVGFGIDQIKAKILEINPEYQFYTTDGHVADDILVAEIKQQKSFNVIIFSKDRACQLELLLRSFAKYVESPHLYTINVLYTYSNGEFRKGYDKLMKATPPNVKFKKEQNFKQNLLSIFGDGKYTIFLVDDMVFKNPVNFYDKQMDIFNEDHMILCRSLRLQKGLTYCYPSGEPMFDPPFGENNVYEWYGQSGDYGYPLSVDGHIFRSEDIYPFVKNCEYKNPNSMEGAWQHQYTNRTKMICYDKSVVVNNPVNKVQTVNGNKHGEVPAEFLNDEYLQGKTIDLTAFDGIENKSCHQEIEINLLP